MRHDLSGGGIGKHVFTPEMDRLQAMLDEASVVPKERVISLEPPAYIKRRRKEAKQHHSKKKQRRSGRFDG